MDSFVGKCDIFRAVSPGGTEGGPLGKRPVAGVSPVERGVQALRIEAEALGRLPERLGEDFARAVELVLGCRGRVVVTGMGKSGLIGQKISATLSSVGAPSFFLHPAEGVHGNLGMVTRDDVILALSYSGETGEVIRLLPTFARLGTPVIAITGGRDSTLWREAGAVLDVFVEEEACPMNLTPTASSTASLAMGDALAMAVLEASGFRPEDFARFHPGGTLGKRLVRVEELMCKGADVPRVRESDPPEAVVREMSAKQLGMTCVVDGAGRLAGVITDGDLRRALERGHGRLPADARGLMSASPKTIGREEMAAAALQKMEGKITSLVVTDGPGGGIEGVIHLHHLLRNGIA
ncbi:MAG: KpsF/GutQ family sugar-phosphate isomerase [Candidatus Tectomicrobia bacterium]|nr:KpsF/GutQ family sugar-phosphate isomerase [Candidatus Tectomicrobia bacterium]